MQEETVAQLEMLLRHLNNWFVQWGAAREGHFTASSGALVPDFLPVGQYYRIRGSRKNDGLHMAGAADLADETFDGRAIPLQIPEAVVKLSGEIAAWQKQNPESDKTRESFGGYSYTREGGTSGGFARAFASQLRLWRRPYAED